MIFFPVDLFTPGINGYEAAVTANQRDQNAFNTIQAGQLDNAFALETFSPRVNQVYNAETAGNINNALGFNDLAASGLDLALRQDRQPSLFEQQRDRADIYSNFGRTTLARNAADQARRADLSFEEALLQSGVLSDPEVRDLFRAAIRAQLQQRAFPQQNYADPSSLNFSDIPSLF